MADEAAPELPVAVTETATTFALSLADRVVVLSKSGTLLSASFEVEVPPGKSWQLLLTGLAPGSWSLRSADGTTSLNTEVGAEKNTAFAVIGGDHYTVQPSAIPGAPRFAVDPDFMPKPSAPLVDRVFVDGRLLPNARVRAVGTQRLLPVRAVAGALGLVHTETAEGLCVASGARMAVFQAGDEQFALNDCRFTLPTPALREDGEWYVSDAVLAALAGRSLVRDEADGCVELPAQPIACPDHVLWIEADPTADPQALQAMLATVPGRTEYWAAEGREVRLDITLRQPAPIQGVGIQWHQGNKRQAKFAVETSPDGTAWTRVFDGTSSGKDTGLETYRFPPSRPATCASSVWATRPMSGTPSSTSRC